MPAGAEVLRDLAMKAQPRVDARCSVVESFDKLDRALRGQVLTPRAALRRQPRFEAGSKAFRREMTRSVVAAAADDAHPLGEYRADARRFAQEAPRDVA